MKRFVCVALALMLAAGMAACGAAEDDGYIDHYIIGRFKGSHDVYEGPGEEFYRAAGGKAYYGGGMVRYYGTGPGGWALIGYSLTAGGYRLGYVHATYEDMSEVRGSDKDLVLKNVQAVTTAPLRFYDNPGIGSHRSKPLCTLPEGAEVTLLGEFNEDWTYVAIGGSYLGSPARGFVPGGHVLSFAKGPGSEEDGDSGGDVLVEGQPEFSWKTTARPWKRILAITSGEKWRAVSEVNWIFLSAKGNELQIQLGTNAGPEERTGVINIQSGESTARIVVTQSGE